MTDLTKMSKEELVTAILGPDVELQGEFAKTHRAELLRRLGAAPSEGMKPLSPARSGEPPKNERQAVEDWFKLPDHDLGFKHRSDLCEGTNIIDATCVYCLIITAMAAYKSWAARPSEPSAPQTSAEQYIGSDQEMVFLEKKALGDFAASQPVSRDAPKVEEIRSQLLAVTAKVARGVYMPDIDNCRDIREARAVMERGDALRIGLLYELNKVLEQLTILRPYFPPASQTPKNVIEAATELLDAMETCHICKGALILQEHPVHCEGCPSDCENHEGTECTPIYVLHAKLRKLLKLATPASTARTDALLNLLRAADDVLAEQSLINQRFTQKQDALFAELMGWRDANGILAAPGSVPPLCNDPDCGDCYDKREALEHAQKGVPQAEPPKEESK